MSPEDWRLCALSYCCWRVWDRSWAGAASARAQRGMTMRLRNACPAVVCGADGIALCEYIGTGRPGPSARRATSWVFALLRVWGITFCAGTAPLKQLTLEWGTRSGALASEETAGPSTASSLCDDFAQDDICFRCELS